MRPLTTALLAAVLVAAPSLSAQNSPGGSANRAASNAAAGSIVRPPLQAAVRTGDIRIDGRIDDPAWQTAPIATDFIQSEPDEGKSSERKTEARILVDDEAIYVGWRMYEDPKDVGMLMMRRDERSPLFDWVGFSLDANHDRRSAYAFRVSAAGVQEDYFVSNDQFEDFAWNAVWESAVALDSQGWTAEMRIPLSQIRYASVDGPRTWGINFNRRVSHLGEQSHFAFLTQRKEEGIVSRFVELQNVVIPRSVRRIEARPYVLSSLHSGPAEDGDPYFDGSAQKARVGSDFRLGLGSAFTLDATVNPDFGQVDADPAEINLTAFETFFDERRPFFVEDAQIFEFGLGGQNKLYYSRRVGRAPQGAAPSGAKFVDMPDAATILGAAKVTGRTPGGLSMGFLSALTQAEKGHAILGVDGSRPFDAEPLTQYGVASAQQDFNEGASYVGAIVTALHRNLPGSGQLDFLPDQALSTGLRFEHQFDRRRWRLNGSFAATRVAGPAAALLRIQTASNHYFQRPDATRSQLDSAATSLAGAQWRLQLDRQNTAHWTSTLLLAEVTKGLEVNDLGFNNSRERIDANARLGYREIKPGKILRSYSFDFTVPTSFSHEALDDVFSLKSWQRAATGVGGTQLDTQVEFLNFHSISVTATWQWDQFSRDATRGGPIMKKPGVRYLRLGYNSDRRKPLTLNAGASVTSGLENSGSQKAVNATLGIRPTSTITLELEPRFATQVDNAQYVAATAVLPYNATFGRRYLFGELKRNTLIVETRANYTVSPTLSFQLYAQQLLSSGDYRAYKQLQTPGTFAFVRFGRGTAVSGVAGWSCAGGTICKSPDGKQNIDFNADGRTDYAFADKNFNVRSLVGNAVLRWEYRPGSTVFLVWQRQQEGDGTVGDFRFGRDFDALWSAPANNRFIVKVNYWLGL